ncbi:MAG TPA: bifunctional diaminohydroxyphosphoribosylaminopyrimidine deaminase/5-amino-6-(5-phosphoribosylamino)uracil reductase RibD [Steroidobacteraceae bacterium]|nr:bifunctional diaminohydroxyphosphoribosylaminopyrimidine deaminase/5-amino-6-(5-phosphoribosylamino)uracil reductase RibD [Steroidobacteraceae bacterium]
MSASAVATPFTAADIEAMRHALGLAALGMNSTDPNPRVGCVLVRDGKVVGEGWHERAGEGHAEARALQHAGGAAAGATAYVTLEPCAAQGRTPPCTQALIGAGIRRVIFAAGDPNPRMRGGAEQLRQAGIDVREGLLAAEARALNPGFFKRNEQGLPWVRVKLGASLDGRTALASGESRWITSNEARHDTQLYRARSSAVLSGIGTVLADDPALNVRLKGANRQPLCVILDSQLRTPIGARLLNRAGAKLIFCAGDNSGQVDAVLAERRAALEARGVRIEEVPGAGGALDLQVVLRRLAQLECNELWVEAGARLAGAFIAANLVDELIVYIAPSLMGHQARPLAELPVLEHLQDRPQFTFTDVTRVGSDVRLTLARA